MTTAKLSVLLVLIWFLIVGCQSSPSGSETGAGGAATPAATTSAAPPTQSSISGEEAMKAMREAMSKATSWRVEMSSNPNGQVETVEEVVCPDRKKHVTMGPHGVTEIRVGGDRYWTFSGSKVFRKEAVKGKAPVCAPGGGYPWKEPAASGKTSKGGVITAGGETCQEWVTVYPDGVTSTVCTGGDNLPRKAKVESKVPLKDKVLDMVITLTFSNWNKVPPIEAPK